LTATFDGHKPFNVAGVGYDDLQAAYDSAADGAEIRIMAGSRPPSIYSGMFTANQAKTVTLKGGYDSQFSEPAVAGVTTITGGINVNAGKLIMFNNINAEMFGSNNGNTISTAVGASCIIKFADWDSTVAIQNAMGNVTTSLRSTIGSHGILTVDTTVSTTINISPAAGFKISSLHNNDVIQDIVSPTTGFNILSPGSSIKIEANFGTDISFLSNTSALFTFGNPNVFTVITSSNIIPTLAFTGTLPTGITFKDNGDGTAEISGTLDIDIIGTYPITISATILNSTVIQNFTLSVGKPTAFITLGNLNTTYNGSQKIVSATTSPLGLPVEITYTGLRYDTG